jgi:hypothetical protein
MHGARFTVHRPLPASIVRLPHALRATTDKVPTMRVRRPFLLPALAALLGMWLPLVAAAEDVIPPGRESFFVGLCQQPLAGGCASDGISLQKDHAILTFRCPAPLSVELYAPSANRTAALKTAKFLLVTAQPSRWPTGALESLADRLRASEAKRP